MIVPRLAFLVLGLAAAGSAEPLHPWSFVAPESSLVIAMEWRKVLDSEYRDAVRREVPPSVSPYLNGINFIEGIDRVMVALQGKSPLIVLTGRMDPEKLRTMAMADGGKSQKYKGAELLLSAEDAESDTQMAVVNDATVLLGDKATILAAIDRSGSPNKNGPNPGSGYQLWVRSRAPAPGIASEDFTLQIGTGGVKVDSRLRAASQEIAVAIAANARLQEMIATQSGSEVHVMANVSRDTFMRKAGQWRTSLQQLTAVETASPAANPARQTIRIYGLEGGTREIPLGQPK